MSENSKLELKAQAMQLYKMLSKPFCQRMPFQGVQIAKTLQKVLLLNKLFDMKSQSFINLCISSQIIKFTPQTQIYSGEFSNERCIYIIIEGSANAKLKIDQCQKIKQRKILNFMSNQQTISNIKNQQNCYSLSEFGLFGHTQIFFSLPDRQQKIISGQKGLTCMVLPESNVINIISEDMKNFMAKAYHYLQVNQYFSEITQFEKRQLVFYMSIQSFKKGTVIIQKDSPLTKIIFIVNGNIKVIKSINNSPYLIDSLQEMNSYGEYQSQNKVICGIQLIANSNGLYYKLDYQNLKQSYHHNILNTIRDKAIPYPDEEELEFLYDIKNILKITCDKVVKKNKLFEVGKKISSNVENMKKRQQLEHVKIGKKLK